MTPTIGVILFPGTNCELEALRACDRSKMRAEIFRWNEDRKKLKSYDGFIIPGGFSYEDRGRSGVIAAKDPVMDVIKSEAAKGKPIIGICNGAQILVEKGLIPGLTVEQLEMSLSYNERVQKGKILGVGFYNDWIRIKSDAKPGRSAFNNFKQELIFHIPVAHGEGRFTTREENLLKNLIANEQTLFRYCDAKGNFHEEFPVNPNGALYNLAGVCNPAGNVLALMPHPERTINGQPIFDSMAEYAKGKFKIIKPKPEKIPAPVPVKEETGRESTKTDIAITVELIITDNEERTIENAVKKMGFKDARLKRKLYYAFGVQKGLDLKEVAEKIIRTGEIVNLNKEIPTIHIADKAYAYDKKTGLTETQTPDHSNAYYATELDNFFGKSVMAKMQNHFTGLEILSVSRGVMWDLKVKKQEDTERIIKTHIFHNPNSMKLVKI
jgi:phosphoribosylformylglycinamidine synthase subunit PurQ / glutaminase